jgi:hypothetical protein
MLIRLAVELGVAGSAPDPADTAPAGAVDPAATQEGPRA